MKISKATIITLFAILVTGTTAGYTGYLQGKQRGGSGERLTITGTSTIKSEPDEYVFSPYYELGSIEEATIKSTTIVDELKKKGVDEKQIKTNTNRYDKYVGDSVPSRTKDTTTLQVTITLTEKEKAQVIQDYLASTSPIGSVSPSTTFSETKRKKLVEQASEDAIKDARAHAEKRATLVDRKIGKVVSLDDSNGGPNSPIFSLKSSASLTALEDSRSSNLGIFPGQDDFSYSVSVVFELK
jgi:uncharacterized protein YggE